MNFKSEIQDAMSRREIIRVSFEDADEGWVDGYVAAVGPEFVVLEVFDIAARLDGFTCLRYADIAECIVPAPHAAFLEKALRARNLARRSDCPINPASLPSLLQSASAAFPLLSVHYNDDEGGWCNIGKLTAITDTTAFLLEISPDATWDSEPLSHDFTGIVRVDCGGAYEEALFLAAGVS